MSNAFNSEFSGLLILAHSNTLQSSSSSTISASEPAIFCIADFSQARTSLYHSIHLKGMKMISGMKIKPQQSNLQKIILHVFVLSGFDRQI